ncbi:MAG: hypothetical protein WBQ11_07600, partial [Isosphaeraceae bacterium]
AQVPRPEDPDICLEGRGRNVSAQGIALGRFWRVNNALWKKQSPPGFEPGGRLPLRSAEGL